MVFFSNTGHLLGLVVACVFVCTAMADSSKEKEECTEQLAGLATCLPYVGGQPKAPTPDCYSGLKQLLKNNKTCLCVIIKDRNDPDIGSLQINVTLTLSLPSVCNAPANVSKCPELLHIDPKSPKAQVFYQLDKGSSTSATSSAPTPTASGNNTGKSEGGGGSSQETSATQKNEAFYQGKRFLGLNIFVVGLQVWALMIQILSHVL